MESHIRHECEMAERAARMEEYEAAFAADEANDAARDGDAAYCARAIKSYRAGEDEDVFEARETAAQAAQYRVTDRANAAILQAFGVASVGTGRKRRAA